jgi:hypothetical protein
MGTKYRTSRERSVGCGDVNVCLDDAYFFAHEHELMRDYAGKYVAICGEEVVGIADSLREMHQVLLERYQADNYVLVRKVSPESFAPPREPTVIVL